MIVQVDDADLDGYCRALPAPDVYSNTAGQLWGLAATDEEADGAYTGGSAYLVSAEAFKRLVAGRLS